MLSSPSFWKKKLEENAIGATFKNTKGNKFTIIGVVDDPDTKTSWMPDIFMSDELDEFRFFRPYIRHADGTGYRHCTAE